MLCTVGVDTFNRFRCLANLSKRDEQSVNGTDEKFFYPSYHVFVRYYVA